VRRRSPTATTASAGKAVAAVLTAALSAALLSACGPGPGITTDGKATPAGAAGQPATTAATRAAAATSATPAGTGPASTPATTAAPAATPGPAATTAKPTAPAIRAPHAAAPVMAVGSHGQRVRELQARLRQLHLFDRTPTGTYGTVTRTAVRDFQQRHGVHATGSVDKATWTELRALTRPPTHKEMYPEATAKPADRLDPRCMTGRAMCVSKTTRTLSWVVDGTVLATMDVRFGARSTPTREGLFHVTFKSRHHVSTLYNSPMPYAMFFSGGEAVHYSSDFAARGYAGASHGCVNVRDKAAIAKLFDEVKVGDKVVVHW
jgi:hypothetical protein